MQSNTTPCRKPFHRRIFLALVPILFGLLLVNSTGCLVSSSSNETRSGNYVSQSTLSQIVVGKTTQEWVEKVMGKPTTRDLLSEGNEIWRYNYTERTESDGAVLFIYGGSHAKETTGTIFVEFKNGVVTNSWRG